MLESPGKLTKTSSENSESQTSIYGIKKKKTSSTKPLAIPDKAIRWISVLFGVAFQFFLMTNFVWIDSEGNVSEFGETRVGKMILYGGGALVMLVVWILLNIIQGILERLRS